MSKRVMIAGGGASRHVQPALAVLDELRRRDADVRCSYVAELEGTPMAEIRAMDDLSCPLPPSTPEERSSLRGARLPGADEEALAALPAVQEAVAAVETQRPDLVIATGGADALPVIWAAHRSGVPVAFLGMDQGKTGPAGRLGPPMGRVYGPGAARVERGGAGAALSGIPVRRHLLELGRVAGFDPQAAEMRAQKLVVLGGPEAPGGFDLLVAGALAAREPAGCLPPVLHYCDPGVLVEVEASYREAGVVARVELASGRRPRELARARLVITAPDPVVWSELSAIGRPALLVGGELPADLGLAVDAGAAVASSADPALLGAALDRVLGESGRVATMARAVRRLFRPDAAALIVDDLERWLGWQFEVRGATETVSRSLVRVDHRPAPWVGPQDVAASAPLDEGLAVAGGQRSGVSGSATAWSRGEAANATGTGVRDSA